jgi:ribosomal-protein-alanine N-acetyltransferase
MSATAGRWTPPRLFLRTERLILRPFEPSDFEAWREADRRQGPRRTRHEPPPTPEHELTRAAFRRMIARRARLARLDRSYRFELFRRTDGAVVGGVSVLVPVRAHTQLGWLGYSIHTHERRKGYGVEAVRAVIEFALSRLDLHRVEAGIDPTNRASVALAKSVGLTREGRLSSAHFHRNRWIDLDVYATTRADPRWGLRDRRHEPPRVRLSLLD